MGGIHQIIVRMPYELHEKLRKQAEKEGKSVNAKVVEVISKAVGK